MMDASTLTTSLISAAKASRSRPLTLALLAALSAALVLRRIRAENKNLLITNLSHVGRTQGQISSGVDEFDVIIVGGGTAGCVLAARLSEDPSISVLVLESGGSGLSVIGSRVPSMFPTVMQTENCWNTFTEPQTALVGDHKVKYWPHGRMLGGSSSMNALIFHHGAPEDLDEWAAKNSDPGSEIWSYSQFHKYFLKFEKHVFRKGSLLVDATVRGSDGPVEVGLPEYVTATCVKFIKSCVRVGIPHVHDLNTNLGSCGVSKLMTYVDSWGRRSSAESAYLTSKVLSRPNLKVAIHAQVTRILFDKTAGRAKAVGVEFANSRDGPRFSATARKQVIVSAGAIHTPQILMLSGIGPAKQLAARSIPLVHDLTGVGSNLMDHIFADVRYRDKSKGTLDFMQTSFRRKMGMMGLFWKWKIFGTGPMTCNWVESAAFVRSTDPKLFSADETPTITEDTSSGPGAPDIELLFGAGLFLRHGMEQAPPGYYWSVRVCLLRPTSVGCIALKTADPFDHPVIDPKYLSTEHDLNVLIRGFKLMLRIGGTRPVSDTVDDSISENGLDHDKISLNDEQLADVIKDRIETIYHPCCTARMAPLSEDGVVDPFLRVHGVSNLRVVDASVFPTIVSGHTAGVVLAVAEQAAELIKNEICASGPEAVKQHIM